MFRLRRYRVFVAFAVLAIFAFYRFSSARDWHPAAAIGAGSLKQFGLSFTTSPVRAQAAPLAPQETQKGTKQVLQEYAHEAVPTKHVLEALAPVVAPTPTPKPAEPQTPTRPSSQPAAPAQASQSAKAIAQPQVPLGQGEIVQNGEGRSELQSAALDQPPIYWEPQPEHFPVSTTIQLPRESPKLLPKIQYDFKKFETDDEADDRKGKLSKIVEATRHSWKGYKDKAWGHDEVKPVTGEFRDPFCGWAATMVDALDTLWIMGLKVEFEEAVRAVEKIDFTTTPRKDIPVFETTIRYLGGMLGAYDISNGQYRILLDKAVELAEILVGAFDTPNRMPVLFYNWMPTFASQPHRAGTREVLAELGSLSIEFTRLAQLTQEDKYYDAIDRITDALKEWQDRTEDAALLPGMWPLMLDASGCHKPTQMDPDGTEEEKVDNSSNTLPLTQGLAGSIPEDEPEIKGIELDSADDSIEVNEQLEALGLPAAGVRRIPGWDEGTKEGELDSQEAKDALLGAGEVRSTKAGDSANARTGRSQDTRLDDHAASGNNKIVGWGGNLKESDLDGKDLEADLLGKPKQDSQAQDPFDSPAAGNHKIGGWGKPVEEGTSDDPRANGKSGSSTKQKRQLGGVLQGGGTRADKQSAILGEVLAMSKSGSEVCLPTGLSAPKFRHQIYGLGAMSVSTYEYLPKEYILLGGQEDKHRKMYETAMDVAVDKLVFRPMTPDDSDILIMGEWDAWEGAEGEIFGQIKAHGTHLTCFVGGMFAMGSKLFDRKQDLDLAAKLTEGCVWAYASTGSGIMPEDFKLLPCDDRNDCTWNQTKYWEVLDPDRAIRLRPFKGPRRSPLPAQAVPVDTSEYTKDSSPDADATAQADTAVAHSGNTPSKRQVHFDLDGQPIGPKEYNPFALLPTPSPTPSPAAKGHYTPSPPLSHEDFVKAKIESERLPPGFVKVSHPKYILRPEAIESVFYMWRITGDPHWREVGWRMWESIEKATRTEFGYSAIDDVTKENPGKSDVEESFWLAETVKYFYLLFAEPGVVSLDEWVLNTEAHPMRRPDAPLTTWDLNGALKDSVVG